jgi:exodeoxyribonuclease VII small subunit
MSNKSKPTIQQKMQKLSELVEWFDGDDFQLEEAIDRFKAAQDLALEIEERLTELKNDIEVIKQKFDSD